MYGIEHYERNAFDSAASNFRLALAKDAANPFVNYLLAVSLAAMGEEEEAAIPRVGRELREGRCGGEGGVGGGRGSEGAEDECTFGGAASGWSAGFRQLCLLANGVEWARCQPAVSVGIRRLFRTEGERHLPLAR